jgi:hypothetical protein
MGNSYIINQKPINQAIILKKYHEVKRSEYHTEMKFYKNYYGEYKRILKLETPTEKEKEFIKNFYNPTEEIIDKIVLPFEPLLDCQLGICEYTPENFEDLIFSQYF